jgi:hypothetical protein
MAERLRCFGADAEFRLPRQAEKGGLSLASVSYRAIAFERPAALTVDLRRVNGDSNPGEWNALAR